MRRDVEATSRNVVDEATDRAVHRELDVAADAVREFLPSAKAKIAICKGSELPARRLRYSVWYGRPAGTSWSSLSNLTAVLGSRLSVARRPGVVAALILPNMAANGLTGAARGGSHPARLAWLPW